MTEQRRVMRPISLRLLPARSFFATIFYLCFLSMVNAQIQIGTVRGDVTDTNDALIPNAEVVLRNVLTGFRTTSVSDNSGRFAFNNVPFDRYEVMVSGVGFTASTRQIEVRSNIPLQLRFELGVAEVRSEVDVRDAGGSLSDPTSSHTETLLSSERLRSIPNVVRSNGLQRYIATVPGVTTQNNGLLSVRGVEDGILYVSGGVPTADRIDAVSASSFDLGVIRSVRVITGNFPAEFGGRTGAIAVIQPESGIDDRLRGEFTTSNGNFRTADAAGSIAYGWKQRFGIFAAGAASRSDRFLDPVDERNFNNRGSRRNLGIRADWQPGHKDLLFFDIGLNGSDLRVPNDLIQEENGQRQFQELRDNNLSASWQRAWNGSTVTNLIAYRRSYKSDLFPSAFDIPISATQDRKQARTGVIGSITYGFRGHSFKTGFETSRINVREFFSFVITDVDLAEDREISDAAQAFTPGNPFIFRDSRIGNYSAAYIQDQFSPFTNLTISAGLRFERTNLPVAESQISPRIGIAYFLPRSKTVLRASFNRLFQPPQLENLLLSDSAQARALSPFLSETEGGARVLPERVSAYELGAAQQLWNFGKLDVAFWWRNFRDFSDPNTFFNTTIVFQNSVNKGFSRGLDARVEIAQRRGFSGYLSYTNSRILQIGPINGGLFLTDEFIEIGPGTRFVPDHDQRNVGSFAVTYNDRRQRWFITFGGRHESGVPLEVEEERLAGLMNAPGADLVNFERGRVRPWTVFDLQTGVNLFRRDRSNVRLEMNVRNIFDRRFAYNFGSPFEGTHFGHPRLVGSRLTINVK
jgi:hypothetical protein